ncbi:MAG: ECF-type sigma factor [bacterium]
MNIHKQQDITQLLDKLQNGDQAAQHHIMLELYQELKRIAGSILAKENDTITYQATELLNEAYIKLFNSEAQEWTDKNHFVATASLVMRRFLVDHARKKRTSKRIPKNSLVPIVDEHHDTIEPAFEIEALDDALNQLELLDKRQAKIVELRFFGGLSESEIAQLMEISRSTVNREWKLAKMWLLHQIQN